MATRPITGGAARPSTTPAAALAMLAAFAIGSAPIWALMLAGGN